MTYLDIRMVMEEIEAWERKERGRKLTWATLERIFPFSRQTMYSKSEVRKAYATAKARLKGDFMGTAFNENEISNLEVIKLKRRIRELERQLEDFQKLWIETKFKP